jgi:hypothetical protein
MGFLKDLQARFVRTDWAYQTHWTSTVDDVMCVTLGAKEW